MVIIGERQTAEITTIERLGNKIHIIAVVVSINENGAEVILDDGTGRITARNFENPMFFAAGIKLGDIVRVIGNVRSFNEHIYLIPEIIKKIQNKNFVTLHKLLLKVYDQEGISKKTQQVVEMTQEITHTKIEEEIPIDADDTIPNSPFDELLHTIKKLDKGDGAQIEEIIAESGENSERIIHNLLETGEIFEIKPGRIKIL